jgi:hypothetical protein
MRAPSFRGFGIEAWIIPQLIVKEITTGAGLATVMLLEALIVML